VQCRWCWRPSTNRTFCPARMASDRVARLTRHLIACGTRSGLTASTGCSTYTHLRAFLDQRVKDGVIRRMIDKWLNTGVVEDGLLRRTTEGTPQGGVVSPCISNIFLHPVARRDDYRNGRARNRWSRDRLYRRLLAVGSVIVPSVVGCRLRIDRVVPGGFSRPCHRPAFRRPLHAGSA
jgi:hypothetical protein